jgi:hypothetical protein
MALLCSSLGSGTCLEELYELVGVFGHVEVELGQGMSSMLMEPSQSLMLLPIFLDGCSVAGYRCNLRLESPV